jgi:hypothetical protein
MTPGRRTLRYGSLDEIMPDVERLLAGHKTVGNWSLGQICHHLAVALRSTVDPAASISHDPSQFVSAEEKRQFFESGLVEERRPMPPKLAPPELLDDRQEADELGEAIARYMASPCLAVSHRRFGPLSRSEWDQFHCIHCAHHLSFAIPVKP